MAEQPTTDTTTTIPGTAAKQPPNTPHLVISPVYEDPKTGALWVHKDYIKERADFDTEGHVGPINTTVALGDVESWAAYVTRYGFGSAALLTWNTTRLSAVLDYHEAGLDADTSVDAGRCAWQAVYQFQRSPEWTAWFDFCSRPRTHKEAVEFLEERAGDIVYPAQLDLLNLVRSLKTHTNSRADSTVNRDGTTAVVFAKETSITTSADVELPPYLTLGIPIIWGHVDADGRPQRYSVTVFMRAAVDEGKLALRFALQEPERVIEHVIGEVVAQAKQLVAPNFSILRSA